MLSVFAVALAVLAPTTGRAQAQTFTLRVNAFVDGTGKVTSSPAGISCTTAKYNPVGPCSANFAAGTVVTLTAVPGEQNTFEGWSGGGCTGTGDCQVTVNDNIDVRPNFVATRYQVTIVGAGNGTGTLHEPLGGAFGDPPIICTIRNGVAVDTRCTTTVAYNSVIQLELETNVAGTNSFRGCDGQGGSGPCSARIIGNTTITATVVAMELRVRSAGGTGTGTVTTTTGNAQINCTVSGASATGVCGKIYTSDTPGLVTLIPTPAEGSRFVGWSGACTSDPCTFLADYPPNVPEARALFEALPENTVKLVVNGIGGFGHGHVTSSPAGIDCDFSNNESTSGTGTCLATFPVGTSVQLTATPRDGSRVLGFTGDCASQSTTCTVIMYHDRSATVQLDPARFPVTVVASGSGSGRVTGSGINCTVTRGIQSETGCSSMYAFGSTLQLLAAVGEHSKFVGFSIPPCTVATTCTVGVSGPLTVTASYLAQTVDIVGSGTGSGRVHDTTRNSSLDCRITPSERTGICWKVFDAESPIPVSLVAEPEIGSAFVGWSGLCSGTAPCNTSGSFPPNDQLVAHFERLADANPVVLTVVGGGTGRGTVTIAPGSTQCEFNGVVAGDHCAVPFAQPAQVSLTASPQFGSTFGGWTGDACSTTDLTCTFSISASTTVSVNFISPHSPHDLGLALTGGFTLTPNERQALDRLGNRNGEYDLGDLLAYLDRTGQKLTATDAAQVMKTSQTSNTPATTAPTARRVP